MRFQLLGHVRAVIDEDASQGAGERAVELGPRKQRMVCALLALEANRVVAASRLIDLAWPDGPPASARAMIHTYVSALRAVLVRHGAAAAGVELASEPAGYTLRCDPDRIDAHRFRRLVAAARREADPERRAAALEQALALWRGPALAAVCAEATRARLSRHLDEARLVAIEDRAEALLLAGRHADLVDELIAQVQEHPQRQRLTGQLMTALHRCGRPDEALRVYERARRDLAEELGLDPGEELRTLYHTLLDGGGSQAPRTAAAASTPDAVPAQLPSDVSGFTGRSGVLGELDALLAGGGPARDRPAAVVISAIAGMAGVGKTALAVHWAHRVANRFPDGQLYVDLRGFHPSGSPVDPGTAIRGFLEALAVPPHRVPASPDALVARYRSLLAGRRMLVVLDNAHSPEQVRPLLPGAPGCVTLITSRNQMEGLVAREHARLLTLDVMSTEEAWELLTRRLGQRRVAAEPEAVDELIVLCARLPLALAIVAARATTRSTMALRTLADDVGDAGRRLSTLDAGDPLADVRAVFSWSLRNLPAGPARLFRLLGLYAGPDISGPAAASLAGLPVARTRALLAELARAHLVTELAPDRYSMHDLLRLYAAECVGSDPDRQPATRRLLDHYLHSALAADRALYPSRDPIEVAAPAAGVLPETISDHDLALDWFAAEHHNLVSTVEYARDTGLDDHCWSLAWTLVNFLERRGHWQDWIATQRHAVEAARRLADLPQQALAARLLGRAHTKLAEYDAAGEQLRTAIDLAERHGDPVAQAHALVNFAQVLENQSRFPEALAHTRRALALYEAADHTLGRANALNAIGWFQAELGDHPAAIASCRRALAMHRSIGNRSGLASTNDTLGYAHHLAGRYREAATYYQRAADIDHDLGSRFTLADTLARLGDVHHAADDPTAARKAWEQALSILRQIDHPSADAVQAKLAGLA